MQRGKVSRQEIEVAEAKNRQDRPREKTRVVEFDTAVVRSDRGRTDDEDEPVCPFDGVPELLQEGPSPAWHPLAIEPDFDSRRRQIPMKPYHERFIVLSGVGQKGPAGVHGQRAVVRMMGLQGTVASALGPRRRPDPTGAFRRAQALGGGGGQPRCPAPTRLARYTPAYAEGGISR